MLLLNQSKKGTHSSLKIVSRPVVHAKHKGKIYQAVNNFIANVLSRLVVPSLINFSSVLRNP